MATLTHWSTRQIARIANGRSQRQSSQVGHLSVLPCGSRELMSKGLGCTHHVEIAASRQVQPSACGPVKRANRVSPAAAENS